MKKIREESRGLAVQVNSLQDKGTSLESRDTHVIVRMKLCDKSHKATDKDGQEHFQRIFIRLQLNFIYLFFFNIFFNQYLIYLLSYLNIISLFIFLLFF